jgi:hypothetical protein
MKPFFDHTPPAEIISGSWYGVYMEYDRDGKSTRLDNETVTFTPGKHLATTRTATDTPRERQLSYTYENQVLVGHYYASRDGVSGGAAYILSGSASSGVLKGYYICTDPELGGRLVIGPYVLTTAQDAKSIEQIHSAWFKQPTMVAPSR